MKMLYWNIRDFVKHPFNRKKIVATVRFSCAYNLDDNDHLVNMLQDHVQTVKLICESSCKKTNFIENNDKARDQEISNLETVLL